MLCVEDDKNRNKTGRNTHIHIQTRTKSEAQTKAYDNPSLQVYGQGEHRQGAL